MYSCPLFPATIRNFSAANHKRDGGGQPPQRLNSGKCRNCPRQRPIEQKNDSQGCKRGGQYERQISKQSREYRGAKRCGACSQKPQCTSGQYKYLAIHMHEPARQRARDLANTPAFVSAQRERKKVEAMFAELKNVIGLRRLRLRRMKFVREQFFLAAAAQNVKRLVRFLSQPITPIGEATT